MKANVLMCFLVVLAGCSTQHAAVRCDDRLEPINQPAGKLTRENSGTHSTASIVQGEDDRE